MARWKNEKLDSWEPNEQNLKNPRPYSVCAALRKNDVWAFTPSGIAKFSSIKCEFSEELGYIFPPIFQRISFAIQSKESET